MCGKKSKLAWLSLAACLLLLAFSSPVFSQVESSPPSPLEQNGNPLLDPPTPPEWLRMPTVPPQQAEPSMTPLQQAIARLKWWDAWSTKVESWYKTLQDSVLTMQASLLDLKRAREVEIPALEKQVRDLTAIIAARDATIARLQRESVGIGIGSGLLGGLVGYGIKALMK